MDQSSDISSREDSKNDYQNDSNEDTNDSNLNEIRHEMGNKVTMFNNKNEAVDNDLACHRNEHRTIRKENSLMITAEDEINED